MRTTIPTFVSTPTLCAYTPNFHLRFSTQLSQTFQRNVQDIVPIPHDDKPDVLPKTNIENYISKQQQFFYPDARRYSKDFSLAEKLNVDLEWNPLRIDKPEVCGHRGALFSEVENTVKSFRAAAAMGCDSIELDVFLLKDGNLVVFHGDGTDKTPGLLHSYCGVEGSILDYDWNGVQNLQFNKECKEFACDEDKFRDSYIPLLEEVLLEAKKSGIHVTIELKGPGTEIPSLELVEKLDMVDQCSFSSFNHDKLAIIRHLRPERKLDGSYRYKTGCLFSDDVPSSFLEDCDAIGATEVHLKYDTCTRERVSLIHEKGMKSMAWFRGPQGMKIDTSTKYFDVGNEDETMYQILINTGVTTLCVNQPGTLLNLVANTYN